MAFHKTILAFAAIAGLAACEAPQDPNAGPGPQRLSAAQAAGYFAQVCGGANRNNAAGSRATLAAQPFVLNTTENRYYHQTLDLSFVVSAASAGRSYCEMGWRSDQSLGANSSAVRSAVPGTQVDSQSGASILFYRAVLIDNV